jgi:sugar O-acyltransferase (sialic acid O-acetyltransferase NeuD family)
MIQTKDISIIGYSGHSYVCIDAALSMGHDIIGYFEQQEKETNPYNLSYLGTEKDQVAVDKTAAMLFVAIGNNNLRESICKLDHIASKLATLVHETAYVSATASIGKAVLVSAGAVINPLASIDNGVICNTGCIIEHECSIGAFSHVAPGAVLAGNVKVGKRVFIGANSTIKEGVIIADDVVIGAGSVVLNDILEAGTYVGVPVKKV